MGMCGVMALLMNYCCSLPSPLWPCHEKPARRPVCTPVPSALFGCVPEADGM